ncbi:MAG: NAD-dependent epimerase/dehydratase family protein [Pseudomonadota bacterium]
MDNAAAKNGVGVLGATSFVGTCLLPSLIREARQITAFSRHAVERNDQGVKWQKPLFSSSPDNSSTQIPLWICVAPIWVLPDYFDLMRSHGVQRVVALSSTSRFTKQDSSDPEEQAVARRLIEAEAQLQEWAERHGIDWVILRPTLIYGDGQDRNISEIVRFIRRFHFFPLFGKAKGLRQPIHAQDVASACVGALLVRDAANHAYNISGGETLSYREMVIRVFDALGRRPRVLTVPLWIFRLAVSMLRCLPRYRQWSAAMAERMNRDLVFDHTEAARVIGFKPRQFSVSPEDVAK